MTKASLKERIEGNELDLSLNNLTAIPVEELASIPKVMALDLSNNAIPAIPASFCLLKHLIRIDLSKNNLTELPANFGNLRNLKHLDLLGNQISVLPLSFCHLDKLQWLDLKDNPLKSDLRKEAGDCLDENQCRKCAVKVVQYMKRIQSQVESEKQKKLKRIRDDEIKAKEKEEKRAKETQEKRKRRKKEWEAEASNKIGDQLKSPSTTKEMGKYEDFKDGHSQKTNEIAPTTCRLLICSLFFLLTAMGIALIFIQPEKFFEMWRETKLYIKESATLVENIAYNLFFSVKQRLGIK